MISSNNVSVKFSLMNVSKYIFEYSKVRFIFVPVKHKLWQFLFFFEYKFWYFNEFSTQHSNRVSNCICIKPYGLSGNDYRVATLSKSFLIVIGVIMQSLKLIGQF